MTKSEDEKICLEYLRDNPKSNTTSAFLAGRASLADEIAKLREQNERFIEFSRKFIFICQEKVMPSWADEASKELVKILYDCPREISSNVIVSSPSHDAGRDVG